MERIGIHPHLIKITQSLYKNPRFRVNINGNTSDWKKQETGIRQGCPLSPYLFLIVMTTLFSDLHSEDHLNTFRHRPNNCNFSEILYADDTILISNNTRAINGFLAEIEEAASLYGLKLNKGKCVALCMYGNPDIKFSDGTRMSKVEEAVYLGVKLNKTMDMKAEIADRIKHTVVTWKKLGEYWKHGNVSIRDKLLVLNAVIRSKLLYGLESAQLNPSHIARLNTIQLKGLRQILHITTTYIDRTHTNDYVLQQAQSHCKENVEYKLFSEAYQKQKTKLLGHVLRCCDTDPEKFTTLQSNTPFPYLNKLRRVGQPRLNWAIESMKVAWRGVREEFMESEEEIDIENRGHIQTINIAAHTYYI